MGAALAMVPGPPGPSHEPSGRPIAVAPAARPPDVLRSTDLEVVAVRKRGAAGTQRGASRPLRAPPGPKASASAHSRILRSVAAN